MQRARPSTVALLLVACRPLLPAGKRTLSPPLSPLTAAVSLPYPPTIFTHLGRTPWMVKCIARWMETRRTGRLLAPARLLRSAPLGGLPTRNEMDARISSPAGAGSLPRMTTALKACPNRQRWRLALTEKLRHPRAGAERSDGDGDGVHSVGLGLGNPPNGAERSSRTAVTAAITRSYRTAQDE